MVLSPPAELSVLSGTLNFVQLSLRWKASAVVVTALMEKDLSERPLQYFIPGCWMVLPPDMVG